MIQKYQVVPLHTPIMANGSIEVDEKDASKRFFECMEKYYDGQGVAGLVYMDTKVMKIMCYHINDALIFVADKPFQKKDLSSVLMTEDALAGYAIKSGLEKQTGFKLIECENGN